MTTTNRVKLRHAASSVKAALRGWMKVRASLRWFCLGFLLAAAAGLIGANGLCQQWRRDAVRHYAACYTSDPQTGDAKWMWLDDYLYQELVQARSALNGRPSPTPSNTKWEKM